MMPPLLLFVSNGTLLEELTAGRASGGDVLVHLSPFHDENHTAEGGNILKRIAVNTDDVGFHTGCESSDLILHADGFSCSGRCSDDGGHGGLSAVPYAIDELLEVSSEAACPNVGSEDDFDFAGHSALESIDPNRDAFLHVLESLGIKISYAQKFVFVLDVVVQQKSEIGIVVGPMLRDQI